MSMSNAAHKSHCCKEHGCKYGDDDCPVVNGSVTQLAPCQDCDEDATIESIKLNSALQKFAVGDGITDDELDLLLAFFEEARNNMMVLCDKFDKAYGLALVPINQHLYALKSFKFARDRTYYG